jgi:hypothetical protein
MVYWQEINSSSAQSCPFNSDNMTGALKLMEALRKIQREEHTVSFIGMVSENPDCCNLMGVDVTGSDYSWKKRRI